MPELLGLPFSPWSEKARWALDVRGISYVSKNYQPVVGEPLLRWKLQKWSGPVTVPVLTDDEGSIFPDSILIARWANLRGSGPSLFPPDDDAAVTSFAELSEHGLRAGRALTLLRMQNDREALGEMVPRALGQLLGGFAIQLGAMGIAQTIQKYGVLTRTPEAWEAEYCRVLDALREALSIASVPEPSPDEDSEKAPSKAPVKTLLGQFTFADIAMAQVLVSVEPPHQAGPGLRMGPASRRCFTSPGLRDRYADLILWRDALYEVHRRRPALGASPISNASLAAR